VNVARSTLVTLKIIASKRLSPKPAPFPRQGKPLRCP